MPTTQKDNHRRRRDDRIYDREDPSDDQEYALDQIPECVAFDGLRMASRKASAAALKDIAMAFSSFGLATSLLVCLQYGRNVFYRIVGLGQKYRQ